MVLRNAKEFLIWIVSISFNIISWISVCFDFFFHCSHYCSYFGENSYNAGHWWTAHIDIFQESILFIDLPLVFSEAIQRPNFFSYLIVPLLSLKSQDREQLTFYLLWAYTILIVRYNFQLTSALYQSQAQKSSDHVIHCNHILSATILLWGSPNG